MEAAENKEFYPPLASSSLTYAKRNADLEKRILNSLSQSYGISYDLIKQVKEIATKPVTEETKLRNLDKLLRDYLYEKGGFQDEV